jgi:hypothetical protein
VEEQGRGGCGEGGAGAGEVHSDGSLVAGTEAHVGGMGVVLVECRLTGDELPCPQRILPFPLRSLRLCVRLSWFGFGGDGTGGKRVSRRGAENAEEEPAGGGGEGCEAVRL